MKITILTYGSRGDVQPFIPLSIGLIQRGHSVKLAAPARFKTLVEEREIPFIPIAGEPLELSRHLNDSGRNVIKTARGILQHAIEIGADVLQQAEKACSHADLIVHTFMHAVGAHTLAREKNIPDIHVQLFPMFTPTGDYPNVSLPDLKVRSLNRWTHVASRQIVFCMSGFGYEQVRRRVGLPKRKLFSPFDNNPLRPSTPILCAWSPFVIPPSSDWSSNVHVTGYFFDDPDDAYQPPAELRDFLDAGNPPVCVSFGSMLHREAKKIDQIIRESLRMTNNRGIILSGWSDVKNTPSKEVLYLDAVPHNWLLPRCKMVIHHGGAGTTSAGLRAGIPNLIIPYAADQPFWASRVHAMGVAPEPIPVRKLTVDNLMQEIYECTGDAIHHQAQQIGQELRSEQGIMNSINLIEKYSLDFLR
jgi:sterol 3beta-glucosyltransferase